jgi:hypothetical protein
VARTVLSTLEVWDTSFLSAARLLPGTILDGYRIRRSLDGQAYMMEFEFSGKQYYCPLVSFQSRTCAIDAEPRA